MAAGYDHAGEIRNEKPLWWALGLTAAFLTVEIIGGLLINSLALLTRTGICMREKTIAMDSGSPHPSWRTY